MNILLIPCHEMCTNTPCSNYRDFFNSYKENSNHNVTLIYTDKFNVINKRHIFKNIKVDLIIFFDIDSLRYFQKFKIKFRKFIKNFKNIPIIALIEDIFHYTKCCRCPYLLKDPQIKHILTWTKLSKILYTYKKKFPYKNFDTLKGHFVNTKIYKDYKLDKKYDILMYGSIDAKIELYNHDSDKEYKKNWERNYGKKLEKKPDFYPLRVRIRNLLTNHEKKYKFKNISGGCTRDPKKYYNEELSKLINQSWITICTTSRMDKFMNKYLETAASNSCILGNIPTDYKEIFENNIIEINEFMTDTEILDIIDNALSNKIKLKEMSSGFKKIIDEEYNLNEGVKSMDKIIDKYCHHLPVHMLPL